MSIAKDEAWIKAVNQLRESTKQERGSMSVLTRTEQGESQ